MTARLRAFLVAYESRLARWIRVGLVVLWCSLIWLWSARQGDPTPGSKLFSLVSNSGHVVVFGVLGGLVMMSTPGCMALRCRLAVAGAVFYGAVDELHQSQVKGRVVDLWDVCSDGIGAGIAACAIWWLLAAHRPARRMLFPLCLAAVVSVSLATFASLRW
ncbi:MAG: VanZ family protein [Planctomycetes bacterium]|nr:VanZ family protein [Planctomycetota bacterium]MCB9889411.1 VanZ family protein [Planctomycetota bacterium]